MNAHGASPLRARQELAGYAQDDSHFPYLHGVLPPSYTHRPVTPYPTPPPNPSVSESLLRAFRFVGVIFGLWLCATTALSGFQTVTRLRASSMPDATSIYNLLAATFLPPFFLGALLMLPWSTLGPVRLRRGLFAVFVPVSGLFLYVVYFPPTLLWLSSALWFLGLERQVFCLSILVLMQVLAISSSLLPQTQIPTKG